MNQINSPDHERMSLSFHAIHAICHERDFVVRVNDPTTNFAKRILKEELKKAGIEIPAFRGCIACAVGFSCDYLQPNQEDHKR